LSAVLVLGAACAQAPNGAPPVAAPAAPAAAPTAEQRQISEWKALLDSPDAEKRTAAAVSLLGNGAQEALDVLLEALRAKDAADDPRISILKAAATRRDARFLDDALRLLDDPSDKVREAAKAVIIAMDDKQSFQRVVQTLSGAEASLQARVLICEALGEDRATEAIPVLIALLGHDTPALGQAAYQSLHRITLMTLPADQARWTAWWEANRLKTREEILEDVIQRQEQRITELTAKVEELWNAQLASLPKAQSAKALAEALKCEFAGVRRYAIQEIAKSKIIERVPDIVQMLTDAKDPDPSVRGAAAIALGDIGGASAIPALLATLNDPREMPAVQAAAITALGALKAKQAVKDIIPRLTDAATAKAAAEALGLMGDRAAASPLATLLTSRAMPVEARRAAAISLGALAAPEALPAIIPALADPDVCWFAVDAIGAIGAANPKKPLPEAVPPLARVLLTDDRPDIREAAAVALGKLGLDTALDPLSKAIADPEPRVRDQALKAFVRAAGSRNDIYEKYVGLAKRNGQFAVAARLCSGAIDSLAQQLPQAALAFRIERASCLRQAKDMQAARTEYEAVLRLKQDDPAIHQGYIEVLDAVNASDATILAALAAARKALPDQAAAWWNATLNHLRRMVNRGQAGQAAAAVDALLKESPDLGGPDTKPAFLELRKNALDASQEAARKRDAEAEAVKKQVNFILATLAKDPNNRDVFVQGMAKIGHKAVPHLLQFGVNHEDAAVRQAVIDALEKIASHKFEIAPDATPEQRAAAIEAWKKWWEQNKPAEAAKPAAPVTPAPAPAKPAAPQAPTPTAPK